MLMEWKALNEQDKQDLAEISVQTSDKDREKPKNKRSAEEKIGRLKYHEVLTKKVFAQNERLLDELRWIRRRLERIGEAEYSVIDVEGFAARSSCPTRRVCRKIVKPYYSGNMNVAIQDLLHKTLAEQDFIQSHITHIRSAGT
jgi:hypothetical protein